MHVVIPSCASFSRFSQFDDSAFIPLVIICSSRDYAVVRSWPTKIRAT